MAGSGVSLPNPATIAIVGGGPGGAFTALHLLEWAQARNQSMDIHVFVDSYASTPPQYEGCPKCAGGVSPRLFEALQALRIELPSSVIQESIESINVQGFWKNMKLGVPPDRRMLSVFRGALPRDTDHTHYAFDALLIEEAVARGAHLVPHRVTALTRRGTAGVTVEFDGPSGVQTMDADCVVVATGIKETARHCSEGQTGVALFRSLQPRYKPPRTRKALIFELELPPNARDLIQRGLHYIECSDMGLHLDMCSMLPKQHFLTVSLIGKSVDRATTHKDNLSIIRRFLHLRQIRRTLPPGLELKVRCACNPHIVVGTARYPTVERAAVVGDLATCRQYKDGMLSAYDMAARLAKTIACQGIDERSLKQGYEPLLSSYRRDNHYAAVIYFLYRRFFTSPFLSRMIYQTYASELKSEFRYRRNFGRIFWAIGTGDETYQRIAWWMLGPGTLWQVFRYGFLATLRTAFTEWFFGLSWKGIGRFPVAVSRETREETCTRLLGARRYAQTYLYRIDVRAAADSVSTVLATFGEADRPFLNPRGAKIRRRPDSGEASGRIIDYLVFGGLIRFSIHQQSSSNELLTRFEVEDGFAHGGQFVFEIEPLTSEHSRVSVLLAFDYPRGNTVGSRIYWFAFRWLFPDFLHETLWNHALCEMKQVLEAHDLNAEPRVSHELQI